MNSINLASVDLNLLTALAALLRERSVTRAAQRVGVGQSAMSHSLRRLRDLFGDPLFVRVGRGIEPTPRALQLTEPLMTALASITAVLEDAGDFDPKTSTRRFRLLCSDLVSAFMPELLFAVTKRAPMVTLEVAAPTRGIAAVLRAGDADMALAAPQPDATGLRQRVLGELGWVVLASKKHPIASGRLTKTRYLRYPHIQVRTGSSSRSVVGEALEAAGLERNVALIVPSFVAALFAASRTDLLLTAPEPLVSELASLLRLARFAPPIPIPSVPVIGFWPPRLESDPAQHWFRGRVGDVVTSAVRDQG